MTTKSSIRLIKKEKPKHPEHPELQSKVNFEVDPNRWSNAVRSWVNEFQERQRGETLPAFDSLFK